MLRIMLGLFLILVSQTNILAMVPNCRFDLEDYVDQSWVRKLENPKSVFNLFDRPPELRSLEILQMQRKDMGYDSVRIAIILRQIPDRIPKRWSRNNVQSVKAIIMTLHIAGRIERAFKKALPISKANISMEIEPETIPQTLFFKITSETGDELFSMRDSLVRIERFVPYEW